MLIKFKSYNWEEKKLFVIINYVEDHLVAVGNQDSGCFITEVTKIKVLKLFSLLSIWPFLYTFD